MKKIKELETRIVKLESLVLEKKEKRVKGTFWDKFCTIFLGCTIVSPILILTAIITGIEGGFSIIYDYYLYVAHGKENMETRHKIIKPSLLHKPTKEGKR